MRLPTALRASALAIAAGSLLVTSAALPAAAAEKPHEKKSNAGYENPFHPIMDVTYLGKSDTYSPSTGPGTRFRFKVENDGMSAATWVTVGESCHYTRPDGSEYWHMKAVEYIQTLGAGQAVEKSFICSKIRGSDKLLGGRMSASINANTPGKSDQATSW